MRDHKTLKMLKLFCEECGLNYKGGFVIGLGAMLNGQSLDKLINGKKTNRIFKEFLNHIANGENSPSVMYENAQLKMNLGQPDAELFEDAAREISWIDQLNKKNLNYLALNGSSKSLFHLEYLYL